MAGRLKNKKNTVIQTIRGKKVEIMGRLIEGLSVAI